MTVYFQYQPESKKMKDGFIINTPQACITEGKTALSNAQFVTGIQHTYIKSVKEII